MGKLGLYAAIALAALAGSNARAAKGPADFQYSDVKATIEALAKKFPKTTSLIQIGLSDSGQSIEGLKIGDGPVHNLLVATHHGNEYGATEVAKAFAADVAANPIAGQTLFVIPVLNIDGYNARDRYEPFKSGKSGGGGSQDPNRDYPGPCGTEGPFKLKDTAALAKFVDAQNIVASATLHTYWPAVVYPWGIASQDLSTPYDGIFQGLVGAATAESHYQTGNSTQVIYPANGTFEDYAFWKHGIWSLLFELGDTHTPSDDQVAEMNRVNVPGLRRMYQQAPKARAENHAFTGQCDVRLMSLDRHDE